MATSQSAGNGSRVKSHGLSFDPVANAVLGDELARHLTDDRQVEDHGADGGMLLGGRDAVGARAAADIHDALAARQIDLTNEAAAGAHADRVGGIVVASRVGGCESLDRAHHLQVLGADMLTEPPHSFHCGLVKVIQGPM